MANPIFSVIKEPILDLTKLLTHPLLEEISFAIISFIAIALILWLLSNFFVFKKKDFKTALYIALIVSATSFIIRSISLIFSLTDIQKPIINKFAMMVEVFLLIILIKKVYNQKWSKTIITWIMTYLGKWMVMGIITLIVLLFFTTIPQDIAKESAQFGTLQEIQAKTNFEIIESTYLPQGYKFINVMSINNNSVVVHYQFKVEDEYYILSLKETFMETKPNLEQHSLPVEETITINGKEAIIGEDIYDSISLTWYSSELKLLFVLSTGINGGLDKSEIIKIANSI